MSRAAVIASALAVAAIASSARADILRFATGYPSQAATSGNPGLVSGWQPPPVLAYSLTAFELTVTQQTRIDQFAVVGNTPTPQLHPFRVIVHSSLAAFAANPLNGDIYNSTVWNINSQEPFGAGAGALGMAWNYYTLVHPPGADIILNPGSYAITIYRDNNWRFADSDIDLGTDWLVDNTNPGQLFAWQDFRPSGTAAIDVYGTVVPAKPCELGDIDCNGVVEGADLAILLGGWGGAGQGDLDGDGVTDATDLAILLGAWG